ncbi:MAG: class I SAM-dependent methyltransferase [Pseudomonadota bacterium]|nr:class I SAM-dependent methyltransferase [Gammaproteobacteria bacterium]MBU1926268.1 class I SAM-dependent methyltransferase [Gammaproteobacteria bacterium]MBU2546196.1 class I SAM-dependent methyltransferase [Gammaproteobacteria bacterium]
MPEAINENYESYEQWKNWSGDCQCDSLCQRYFNGEFRNIPIHGRSVLEIGFGNGEFLAWASSKGAQIFATEINKKLVDAAKKRGFQVYYGNVDQISDLKNMQFDVVVAFDVFEHLTHDELVKMLRFLHAHLADHGNIVIRVPNGQSPFGRLYQHGDMTHRNTLSINQFQQISMLLGFKVVRATNSFRVVNSSLKGLAQIFRNGLRNLIEISLSKIYGFSRLPLDPNITVVLEKDCDIICDE